MASNPLASKVTSTLPGFHRGLVEKVRVRVKGRDNVTGKYRGRWESTEGGGKVQREVGKYRGRTA
jgi:hypothetical protein